MNFRPSSIIRGIENVAVGASRMAVSGASHVASSVIHKVDDIRHDFVIEYEARKLAAARREFRARVDDVFGMSPAEVAEALRVDASIRRRAEQLAEADRLDRIAEQAKSAARIAKREARKLR